MSSFCGCVAFLATTTVVRTYSIAHLLAQLAPGSSTHSPFTRRSVVLHEPTQVPISTSGGRIASPAPVLIFPATSI